MRRLLLVPLALALGACAGYRSIGGYYEDDGPHAQPLVDIDAVADAVPRDEPRTQRGNDPYTVFGVRYYPINDANGYHERGIASWYGKKFHGRQTSSGEVYDMYAMTAAHRTLPLPSYVRVRNLENGRSVIARVNDRGPFLHNRLIDLSYVAAAKLGIIGRGTGIVEVETVTAGEIETQVVRAPKVEIIAPAAADDSRTAPAENPPQLFLQVGAFGTWENATNLRVRLERAAFRPIFIQSTSVTSGPAADTPPRIYRVRLGPLASVAEADRITERLAQHGVFNSIVVVE